MTEIESESPNFDGMIEELASKRIDDDCYRVWMFVIDLMRDLIYFGTLQKKDRSIVVTLAQCLERRIFSLPEARDQKLYPTHDGLLKHVFDILERNWALCQGLGSNLTDPRRAHMLQALGYLFDRELTRGRRFRLWLVLNVLDEQTYKQEYVSWELVLRDQFIFNEGDKEYETFLHGRLNYRKRLTHPLLRGKNGSPVETRSTVWVVYQEDQSDVLELEGEMTISVGEFAEVFFLQSRAKNASVRALVPIAESDPEWVGLGAGVPARHPLRVLFYVTLSDAAVAEVFNKVEKAVTKDRSLRTGVMECEYSPEGKLVLWQSSLDVTLLGEFRAAGHNDLTS